MILSCIIVSTLLKTVLYYKMTLKSYLTGQNIGCYLLMYIVMVLHIGNTSYTGICALEGIQLELLDKILVYKLILN